MRVLIAGPPASGKSTLARGMAGPDVTVLDFDEIAVELGSLHPWDHPRDVAARAAEEFGRRVDAAEGDVVAIRSAPTQGERDEWAARLAADQVIILDVAPEEAKRRATRDGRPEWTAAAIDRWWRSYEPETTQPRNARMGKPEPGEENMSVNTVEPNKGPAEAANGGEAGDSKQQRLPADHPLVTAYERQKAENEALRDKARRLDELEEAQKTAEQKAAERLAEAERKAAEAEVRAARASVSASTGIPVEILAGPDDGSAEALQAFADRLAAYIEDRGKPRQPRPDPAQGNGRDLALNGDGLEAALRAKLGVR